MTKQLEPFQSLLPTPRITWVLRSFLDYRVPVFAALDEMVNHQLHVIFPINRSPERTKNKLTAALGSRAISLSGETHFGVDRPQEANTSFCISWQPDLFQTIANTRPDVLIGDGFFQWSTIPLVYRILRRIPLVICYERTAHTERHAQWYRRLYRRVAARFVDAYCVNGQQSLEYTKMLGIADARITTGFMAADTENLVAESDAVSALEKDILRRKWQAKGLVFLFVGQLIKRKGVYPLLQAWSQVEKALPGSSTLIILGTGPEESILKQLATDLDLKAVRFVGAVDYDEIAPFYATADVFIMPTLEDNWSLVVPEAMACGLPVLTSYYNGCWPELVHPNENGWVFDALDVEDVYRALVACVDSRAQLKDMGARSRSIVEQHTPERAAQAILQACEIARLKIGGSP